MRERYIQYIRRVWSGWLYKIVRHDGFSMPFLRQCRFREIQSRGLKTSVPYPSPRRIPSESSIPFYWLFACGIGLLLGRMQPAILNLCTREGNNKAFLCCFFRHWNFFFPGRWEVKWVIHYPFQWKEWDLDLLIDLEQIILFFFFFFFPSSNPFCTTNALS